MSVIDDYLSAYSGADKTELVKVRLIVKAAVPEAKEVLTYGIPGYKYKGKYLVAFFIFKNHLGLFPPSGPIESVKDKLSDLTTSKGGILFTPQKSIPEAVINDILLTRVAQIYSK